MSTKFDASVSTPVDAWERKRLAAVRPASWNNPEPTAPYQLVIIGAGPAGLAAAREAAALGLRVALVERHEIGGTCFNTGCVPSKALLRTAAVYAEMRDAARYGAEVPADIRVDFSAVMERLRRIRSHLTNTTSVRLLAASGVDVFFGSAQFSGPDSLTVNDQPLRFDKALIATGARPDIPDVPGLKQAGFLTNTTIFELAELPPRLLVIGGGPLGCELAQAFQRLGSRVTIVQKLPLFLEREERDAAQTLSDAFARDGIEVRLNTLAVAVRSDGDEKVVDLVSDDYHSTIRVDAILTGVGRLPNVQGLALEKAGVVYDEVAGIRVDDQLRTANPRIHAAGDVCLDEKYTDTAEESARVAIRNAVLGGCEKLSELVVPWCTFTDPEIAHVGMYVREANARGIPVKTFTVPMHQVDRAMTDSEQGGFVKIHVRDGSDRILGATIVARDAGDMISQVTLAMVAGVGMRTLAKVIHAYPTRTSAIRLAAKAYNQTRLSARVVVRLKHWLARPR
ncbi:Mercuric reductase [Rhodanobacter sp. Root179]|uniref:mercuric reductase n=1 Tax=Rhodanobacter sp. Root179 TaxID=1736482 RepID=UPI0006FBAB0D|nr:mercuric reductase [Rhodanobacter sp. Root179]KRB59184.1 mercuric reductase [Rhodanobacter sp. Root179]